MFFKKDKKENNKVEISVMKSENGFIMPQPKICLFDLDEHACSLLVEKGYNIAVSSLGTPVNVPNNETNDSHYCLLNPDYPKNLHEYDIIVIDQSPKKPIAYNHEENKFQYVEKNSEFRLLSSYPQTVFEPRPYTSFLISKLISENAIIIVFASQNVELKYSLVEVNRHGMRIVENPIFNNFEFMSIPNNENIYGEEMEVVVNNSDLKNLFQKNIENCYYEIAFDHPTELTESAWQNRKTFIPLLVNKNNKIVSYIDLDYRTILLPQFKNKEEILIGLLNEILPTIYPEVFPYSTRFSWKAQKDYWLPNHETLVEEKTKIEIKYNKKLKDIEKEIDNNYQQFSFLHKILTETGEELVAAVKIYLEWLGFSKIKNMDYETEGIKEEDLQIEIEEGLLVIEVKGIGGTSKDSDCNQVNKIKYRRSKERGKFDVFALYIVNHQRYLPPKDRVNPPFTNDQIRDAVNEERGLLTTWELYKAYFLIQDEIISKEEARNKLLNFGLINLTPSNLCFLGEVEEVFKEGQVFILNLVNHLLKTGDQLIIQKNETYKKVSILNIQINGKNVSEVTEGEIGIRIDGNIKKKSRVFSLNFEREINYV